MPSINKNLLSSHFGYIGLFIEIVRSGNFSRAATLLDMPVSTLSRRIATMEKQLGFTLFVRDTRRLTLTPSAKRFFDQCHPMLEQTQAAYEALIQSNRGVTGELRISIPTGLDHQFFARALKDFSDQYPQISLLINVSPIFPGMFLNPVDVALRLGPVVGKNQLVSYVGAISQGLFASRRYLQLKGNPTTPADLLAHRCLNVTSETLPIESCFPSTKYSKSEVRIGSPLTSSSPRMLAKLVEQDLGIAILPKNMVVGTEFSHTLEQILPDFKLPSQPLYALMTPKYQSDLSRAFIRFLAEEWANRVD